MEVDTEKVPRANSMESVTAVPYFCAMLGMDEVLLVEVMIRVLSKLRWQPIGLPR